MASDGRESSLRTAMMQVEWRTIPGFPTYEASSEGQIRPVNPRYKRGRGTVLKPWIVERHGRRAEWVSLHVGGKRFKQLVNRLVTLAFHGLPPEGKPDSCHCDHNSLNNRASNLKWGAHSENVAENWHDRMERRAVIEEEIGSELGAFASHVQDQEVPF
jgi:hypothetical protein